MAGVLHGQVEQDPAQVKTDDLLKACPQRAPWRPPVGISTEISDAELVTLAVLQALLGYVSEARWLRFAHSQLRGMVPYLPGQPGYNKRLRKLAATMCWLIRVLARDTSVWADDVWVVDSTPVECGRPGETARRSDLAGYAEYGYCASHSRYFWGLRLHLICTLHGLPVGFALAGAKADERQVLLDLLAADPDLAALLPGQILIGTRTTTGTTSRPPSPAPATACCARPATASPNGPAPGSSSPCARSSNQSTTPSKASSTSNATAGTPPAA